MARVEKLICGDCKAVFEEETGKRGNAIVEMILWSTLFFPGIIYHFWRRRKPRKICDYCGSNFLIPADSPYASTLLKPITKTPKI
jgi:hypothetical protein